MRASRLLRILALTVGLYVLSQAWAQIAMEIEFPMAVTWGRFTAVIFLT